MLRKNTLMIMIIGLKAWLRVHWVLVYRFCSAKMRKLRPRRFSDLMMFLVTLLVVLVGVTLVAVVLMTIGKAASKQYAREVAKNEIMDQVKQDRIKDLESADTQLYVTISALERAREDIKREKEELSK